MAVDCLQCRYCDGRQGGTCSVGGCSGLAFWSRRQIYLWLRADWERRAAVVQVFKCSLVIGTCSTCSAREVQDITVTLHRVVKQFEKSVVAYLRSVYEVYQLPRKEKSTGMA